MEYIYKILIVEDEPEACATVKSFLEKRGFLVLTTLSGLEALSLIKAFKPDLLLLDICLMDLDGIEVLRNLRAYDTQTKVIIMTGQGQPPEEIADISALGINGFQSKPLVLEQMEKLIYQVLGQKNTVQLKNEKFNNQKVLKGDAENVAHGLSNLLGIIRNQCENFTLNIEDGLYKDKSSEDLVKMSLKIMKNIEDTVDRAIKIVEKIPPAL